MTDKLELKSSHEVVYTVNVADVESIFYCKPTDPDILTVLMKDGKRLYCDEVCPIDSLQEEPISIWHSANEKPEHDDLLIETNDGRIIHRQFINNYGMVKRWAYTSDLLNLDNSCNFGKNSQEEPVSNDFEMALAEMIDNAQKRVVEPWVVAAQWKDELINLAKSEEPISEELNEAAIDYAESVDYRRFSNAPWNFVQDVFKAGAKWQITKLMKDATEVTVHIDAGGYPYTPEIELYDYDKDVPLAKEGDKYKVVLIKEE